MKPRVITLSVALAFALLLTSVLTHSQQPAKVYRIGYLGNSAPAPTDQTPQGCPMQGDQTWQAFVEGLRDHGYTPGQNLVIECRWTQGQAERAPALAAELVSLTPDLLVATSGWASLQAAKQATSTIPIVLVNVNDPVGQAPVANLAHPGGNVTGLSGTVGMEIGVKRLQLLKEAAPNVSRVAFLRYIGGGASPGFSERLEAAARALGVTLQFYGVRAPDELEGAFAAMTQAQADALFVEDWAFFSVHAQRIVDLAAQHRLPAVYAGGFYVRSGGLMSYGVDNPAIRRRVGFYVDQIFHGANPGDLPVELPTKFELVINLKTAKALGLTIPQSLLSRADEVIQ